MQFSYNLSGDQYVRFMNKLVSMFNNLGVGADDNPRGAYILSRY